MEPIEILVTGCPRSGTRYTAAMFCRHGVRIGHERVYAHGTSDWRLAPVAHRAKISIHQVRDPLKVIASLQTIKAASMQLAAKFVELDAEDTKSKPYSLITCAKMWLHWTELAQENCEFWHRVENIQQAWPKLQRIIPSLLPWQNDLVLDDWEYNRRDNDHVAAWDDILSLGKLGEMIRRKARFYGYKV